jgi:hypothetical protein
MSYYERSAIRHLDGTAIFQAPADKRNESEVASLIGGAWGCELHTGRLSSIDAGDARHSPNVRKWLG